MFGMCSSCLVHQQILIPHNEAQTLYLFKYYHVFVITTYLMVWKYLCYHTFQLPSVVFSVFIFIHLIHELFWFRRIFLITSQY